MEKKIYVTPNMKVKGIETEALLTTSDPQGNSATIGEGGTDFGGTDTEGTKTPSSKAFNFWDEE